MDQNNGFNNGFNNQNDNDYTNQYNQYNQPQQYDGYNQTQQYDNYAQPQQYDNYNQTQQSYDQQYVQPQQYDNYTQYNQSQQYNQPQQYSAPYFNQQYPAYQEVNNGRKGMGIASMVLGIVSVVICCLWYLTPITSIIGLILGAISLKKEDAGKGMAITGIILSAIGLLSAIFFIVVFVSSFSQYGSIYTDFYSMY